LTTRKVRCVANGDSSTLILSRSTGIELYCSHELRGGEFGLGRIAVGDREMGNDGCKLAANVGADPNLPFFGRFERAFSSAFVFF